MSSRSPAMMSSRSRWLPLLHAFEGVAPRKHAALGELSGHFGERWHRIGRIHCESSVIIQKPTREVNPPPAPGSCVSCRPGFLGWRIPRRYRLRELSRTISSVDRMTLRGAPRSVPAMRSMSRFPAHTPMS